MFTIEYNRLDMHSYVYTYNVADGRHIKHTQHDFHVKIDCKMYTCVLLVILHLPYIDVLLQLTKLTKNTGCRAVVENY